MRFSAKAIAIALLAVTLSSIGLSASSAEHHHSSLPPLQISAQDIDFSVPNFNSDVLVSTFESCAIACVFCILTLAAIRRMNSNTVTEKFTRSKIEKSDFLKISSLFDFVVPPARGLILRM